MVPWYKILNISSYNASFSIKKYIILKPRNRGFQSIFLSILSYFISCAITIHIRMYQTLLQFFGSLYKAKSHYTCLCLCHSHVSELSCVSQWGDHSVLLAATLLFHLLASHYYPYTGEPLFVCLTSQLTLVLCSLF